MLAPIRSVFLVAFAALPCAAQSIQWAAPEHLAVALDRVGDFDGDGFEDIVTGAYVGSPPSVRMFSGRTGATLALWPAPSQSPLFATAVAGPGDVDGDGVPDAAYHRQLPVHGGFTEVNAVTVSSGATGAEMYSLQGTTNVDQFGQYMAAIGDVDGDGHGDLLIGGPSVTTAVLNEGAVYVHSGATGARLFVSFGAYAAGQLGQRVAAAGDCDADGTPDFVVVGRQGLSAYADVYSGATFAKLHTFVAPSIASAWGRAVAGVGDVDANGYADVAIGDEWEIVNGMANAGRVFVHDGASGAVLQTISGTKSGMYLGWTIAPYGDLDGDAHDDFLVATKVNKFPPAPSALHPDARVYSGASGALLASFGPVGDNLGDFGRALCAISDNDGDGIREIAVVGLPQVWSLKPELAGVYEFGNGTPGCAGSHGLHASLAAQIPQPGFQLVGDRAPSAGHGFLALSGNQSLGNGDPYGLGALTYALPSPQFVVFPIHADASGNSTVALPIPNQPSLAGAGLVAQEFWSWLGGPCQPGAIGVSSSRGLFLALHL